MRRDRAVLFVAMSGVRVADEQLRAKGLTLPGFVRRGKVIASLPSLGLLTLAARTPQHWFVRYVEVEDSLDEARAEVATGRYDLVAISTLTARVKEAYELARTVREGGTLVAIGGLHASVLLQEASRHCDIVVQGEAENVWPLLLSDIERREWRAVYRAGDAPPVPFDNEYLVPRYDLLKDRCYNRITMQTTRGCPLDCSFCAASRLISPYKRKPISQVERELDAIVNLWSRPFLELADDNTFVNKRWGKELVRLLAKYPLRWFTETDISLADDDELLDLLAASGCAQVLVGLESRSPASLGEADSRGWKRRQLERYAEKVRRIQSFGISVNGCFVLGFDNDGPEVFQETLDYVRALELSEAQVTVLTPFPGTRLYDDLARQGRLLEPTFWDKCTLFDVTYSPKRMTADELREGFSWLVGELYSESEMARRDQLLRRCVRAGARRRARK